MKPIAAMTFDELVEMNAQHIHAGLLESGGKGLNSAVHYAQMLTLQWKQESDAARAADAAKKA